MPIYEYQCDACGHEFEELQKINEAPVTSCGRCQADQVHRLISKTSFHLKGGGWYADLYGSSSSASKSSSTSSSTSKTDSTSKTSSSSPSSSASTSSSSSGSSSSAATKSAS